MLTRQFIKPAIGLLIIMVLSTCSTQSRAAESVVQGPSDDELQSRVTEAITSASDLPRGLSIQVDGGVVSVSGTLECPDCGGQRTPGALGTIQQSLGAVIRAVPGVADVQFFLASSD